MKHRLQTAANWLSNFHFLCLAGVCLVASLAMPLQVRGAQSIAETGTVQQPQGPPQLWAEVAVHNELTILSDQKSVPVRYLQRKIDAKGDTTREIIESKDGNVARLVERNGRPITAAEDAAERDRLTGDIASPEEFFKRHKRDRDAREDVMHLLGLLPQAMIYTYTPGQPQPQGSDAEQVVLDFRPNPAFRPSTLFADVLTGIEGRAWIDARSHCMTRLEAHVLHPINIGFGFVAKIFPGGTAELEQTRTSTGQWVFSRFDEHVTARVLMVKTLPENAAITSWDFRPMASLLPYQDAIHELLATPIPLQQ